MNLQEKSPPQAVDIEKSLLASIIVGSAQFDDVAGRLTARSFYNRRHSLIWEAIGRIINTDNVTPDVVAVHNELTRTGEIEKAGGIGYLSELCSDVATTTRPEPLCETIRSKAILRHVLKATEEIRADALAEDADGKTVLRASESKLVDLSRRADGVGGWVRAGERLTHVFADIERRMKGIGGALPTGFRAVDKRIVGLENSDLIIIAGRPSMGKTAFALAVALNVARAGVPVGFFSMEMSRDALVQRLASMIAQVNGLLIRSGEISKAELTRLGVAASEVDRLPIHIDDTPNLHIGDFRSRARRVVSQHGAQVIIADYLQLMRGEGKDRRLQIDDITRGLKGCAKELNIPVTALSQLSRAVEHRGTAKRIPRPGLSDLKESGAIEQDADVVLFVHRDEYYKRGTAPGKAQIIVGKQRNGPVGPVEVDYDAGCTRFYEVSPEGDDDDDWGEHEPKNRAAGAHLEE